MDVPVVCERQLELAEPDLLLRSVFTVLARYQIEGLEPGAEHWISESRRYRPKMIGDVFDVWSALTGTDVLFPWHDDYVASMWVNIRKLRNDVKRELCKFYGLDIPDKWKSGEEQGVEERMTRIEAGGALADGSGNRP